MDLMENKPPVHGSRKPPRKPRKAITNAEFYRNSYVEARFAFECYCMKCLQQRRRMCMSDASCDLCQSRWERLPFSQLEHDEMTMEAVASYMPMPFPTNDQADEQLRTCGLLERLEYPGKVPGAKQPVRPRSHRGRYRGKGHPGEQNPQT